MAQALRGDLHQEERGLDAVLGGQRLVGLRHRGDQGAPALQHGEGPLLTFTADEIDHGVDVVHDVLEAGPSR